MTNELLHYRTGAHFIYGNSNFSCNMSIKRNFADIQYILQFRDQVKKLRILCENESRAEMFRRRGVGFD